MQNVEQDASVSWEINDSFEVCFQAQIQNRILKLNLGSLSKLSPHCFLHHRQNTTWPVLTSPCEKTKSEAKQNKAGLETHTKMQCGKFEKIQ